MSNPVLTASLDADENELLQQMFENVRVAVRWSRFHGIATLWAHVIFGFAVEVHVVLKLISLESAPMGCPHTTFSAPSYDDKESTPLSMALTREVSEIVSTFCSEGASLVSDDDASVASQNRSWTFSSGGWLPAAVGGVKDVLETDNRFSSREDDTPERAPTSRTVRHVSEAVRGHETVWLTARVYKLDHMRRPHEYVRTLQSWMSNCPFDGNSGFVSSVIASDSNTPRVFVCVLHVSSTHEETPAAFSTLERNWKTQPVDMDKHGKPCFERLSRVTVDECAGVPAVNAARAIASAMPALEVGSVSHTVLGFGSRTGSVKGTDDVDRSTIEATLLKMIGLHEEGATEQLFPGFAKQATARDFWS